MTNRDLKMNCYQDILKENIIITETILNQINNINSRFGQFDEAILKKDRQKAFYKLELSLAVVAIMIRKMVENQYIEIDLELRRDINSIIHSNKFEYHSNELIYVYSQKGKEDISINRLLSFAKDVF